MEFPSQFGMPLGIRQINNTADTVSADLDSLVAGRAARQAATNLLGPATERSNEEFTANSGIQLLDDKRVLPRLKPPEFTSVAHQFPEKPFEFPDAVSQLCMYSHETADSISLVFASEESLKQAFSLSHLDVDTTPRQERQLEGGYIYHARWLRAHNKADRERASQSAKLIALETLKIAEELSISGDHQIMTFLNDMRKKKTSCSQTENRLKLGILRAEMESLMDVDTLANAALDELWKKLQDAQHKLLWKRTSITPYTCRTAGPNSQKNTGLSSKRSVSTQIVDFQTLTNFRNLLKQVLRNLLDPARKEAVNYNSIGDQWFDREQNKKRLASASTLLKSALTCKFGEVQLKHKKQKEALSKTYNVLIDEKGKVILDDNAVQFSLHVFQSIQHIHEYVEKRKAVSCENHGDNKENIQIEQSTVWNGFVAAERWLKLSKQHFQNRAALTKTPIPEQISKANSTRASTCKPMQRLSTSRLFGEDGKALCSFKLDVYRFSDSCQVMVHLDKSYAKHKCNIQESLKAQGIPLTVEEKIVSMLQSKVPVHEIIKHFQRRFFAFNAELPEQDSRGTHRGMHVTYDLIEAIRKRHHLQIRLHQNDDQDVHRLLWEQHNLAKRGEEAAFYIAYKPFGSSPSKGFGLEAMPTIFSDDDFFVAIASPQMLETFVTYPRTVCCDATHNTSKKDIKLITIMVVDEDRNGFPVMWALSRTESEKTYQAMFSLLATHVERMTNKPAKLHDRIRILMSDKCPSPYLGLKRFAPKVKWFYCTWHTIEAFKSKVHKLLQYVEKKTSRYEQAQSMVARFRKAVVAETKAEFDENVNTLQLALKPHPELAEYFIKNYMSEAELMRWPVYCRKNHADRLSDGSELRTNMFLEAQHRCLKDCDLSHGKRNRRLASLLREFVGVEARYTSKIFAKKKNLARVNYSARVFIDASGVRVKDYHSNPVDVSDSRMDEVGSRLHDVDGDVGKSSDITSDRITEGIPALHVPITENASRFLASVQHHAYKTETGIAELLQILAADKAMENLGEYLNEGMSRAFELISHIKEKYLEERNRVALQSHVLPSHVLPENPDASFRVRQRHHQRRADEKRRARRSANCPKIPEECAVEHIPERPTKEETKRKRQADRIRREAKKAESGDADDGKVDKGAIRDCDSGTKSLPGGTNGLHTEACEGDGCKKRSKYILSDSEEQETQARRQKVRAIMESKWNADSLGEFPAKVGRPQLQAFLKSRVKIKGFSTLKKKDLESALLQWNESLQQ